MRSRATAQHAAATLVANRSMAPEYGNNAFFSLTGACETIECPRYSLAIVAQSESTTAHGRSSMCDISSFPFSSSSSSEASPKGTGRRSFRTSASQRVPQGLHRVVDSVYAGAGEFAQVSSVSPTTNGTPPRDSGKSLELDGSLTFLINFLRRARPPIQGLSEEIARTLHLIESGIALALVSGSMQSGPNRGAGSPTINFKARAPSGFACRLSPGEVSAFVRVASLPIRCRRCGDYVGHPRHAAAKRERWQRSAAAVADVVDAVGPSRLTKAAAGIHSRPRSLPEKPAGYSRPAVGV
ncbi:hypothetical protein MRX96_012517 [Rhipicephalus microplus]